MSDGTGAIAYGYDSLARLSNETRSFNGLAGSYRLDYQYNLTGQVTRLSLHGNVHVDYLRDYAGQVTTVGNTGYADNQPYATGIRYRTSGALTAMTYGNGRTLSLGFDHRLRLARWDVAGLMGWDYHYNFFNEKTGRVTFADSLYDNTLDRSYEYDQVGRLAYSWTGSEAHAHAYSGQWGVQDGPYAHGYRYDERGNLVERQGWGGWNASVSYPFDSQNRNTLLSYDAAGNVTGDGSQLSYDATGQQVSAIYSAPGGWDIQQGYDGDRQRVKKVEAGQTTYCLRSTVLGGQVVAEYNQSGDWRRGYVYDGTGQLLAMQAGEVQWVHQDPVTKSKRVTNRQGEFLSAIDIDPWGGETSKMQNSGVLSQKYTTYERDGNGRDQAMMRSYHAWFSRFDQPDPFDGSYDLSDPQSFNRYTYVQNDPVNFTDPTGLYEACVHEAMTKFLATLTGNSDEVAATLGRFAGDKPGGADSKKYSATSFMNIIKGFFGKGPSADIHFASERKLAREVGRFDGYMALGTDRGYQKAAFVLHSIQDVHGAHQGYSLPSGHAFAGSTPDRIIGDVKFMRAANETLQVLSGNKSASLSGQQVDDLIQAIITGCGDNADQLRITHEVPIFHVDGGIGGGRGGHLSPIGGSRFGRGGFGGWSSLDLLYLSIHAAPLNGTVSVGDFIPQRIHLPR